MPVRFLPVRWEPFPDATSSGIRHCMEISSMAFSSSSLKSVFFSAPMLSMICCGFDVPGYEVKNVRFKDVVLEDNSGPAQNIQMQHCKNVSFENVTVQAGTQPE